VRRADLLLHLVDLTHPLFLEQIQVIEDVLKEIGAGDIPVLLVANKTDAADSVPIQQLRLKGAVDVCAISALTGNGVDVLLEKIGAILDRDKERLDVCLAPEQAALLSLLRERGRILNESYEKDGIRVSARVTPKLAGQLRKLLGNRKNSEARSQTPGARKGRGDSGRPPGS
jgi:GTP-binding protein HflX